MKVVRLFLILAIVLCVPFFLWGGTFEGWFTGDAAVRWLAGLGAWAWLAAIALLVSDLVLPVPATAVMSALGFVYGPWVGGGIAAAGSMLSGALAYGLCRLCGRRMAVRLAGADALPRYESLFRHSGAWLVALSRWMPLLPEVIACLAGLSRMPPAPFFLALACGSIPLGFVYAAIGAAGQERPGLAVTLSIAVPALLIMLFQRWVKSESRAPSGGAPEA